MRAPDAIATFYPDIFRPAYRTGDLGTRRTLVFGSGNAGAGGRPLVSPSGAVLVGGTVPFRLAFGGVSVPAAEASRKASQSEGTIAISAQGSFAGIDRGPVVTEPPSDVGLNTETEGWAEANGKATTEPLTPDTVGALWQALKGQDFLAAAESVRGAPIRPEVPRHTDSAFWKGNPPAGVATVEEARGGALSVDASSEGCDVAASLNGRAATAFAAFPFGYYGRRGCSPQMTLSGALEIIDNDTRREDGEGSAIVSVFRAATAPKGFLTPENEPGGLLPEWEKVLSQTVHAGPFSLPLALEGSTVYLFVLEAVLDLAFSAENERIPELETDSEGHIVGSFDFVLSHANRSSARLLRRSLIVRPAPAR